MAMAMPIALTPKNKAVLSASAARQSTATAAMNTKAAARQFANVLIVLSFIVLLFFEVENLKFVAPFLESVQQQAL